MLQIVQRGPVRRDWESRNIANFLTVKISSFGKEGGIIVPGDPSRPQICQAWLQKRRFPALLFLLYFVSTKIYVKEKVVAKDIDFSILHGYCEMQRWINYD